MKAHKRKNITLRLPEPLWHRLRVFAAEKNQSINGLMAQAIQALMDQESRDPAAKRRFIERIRNAPDRSRRGKIRWSREELHQR